MKGWICNASPVILLGKLNRLPLLESLSPDFRIPKAVALEIQMGPPSDPAIIWMSADSISHHIVDTPPPPPFLSQWDLGAGETAVLSLALEKRESAVVLDDLAARKFALTFNLPLLGTLGLLVRAKKRGLLQSLAPEIHALDRAGANLSPKIISCALNLANEAP